jgi:hypothetical protein
MEGAVRSAAVGLVAFLIIFPANSWAQDALIRVCDLAARRPAGSTERNDPEAASACQAALAANPENPRLLFDMGRVAQSNNDDNQARVFYEKSAAHGYASAQNNLALFYASGRGGLSKSEEEAVRLFRLAAAQGDANAQAGLGLFYETGRGGLPKNDKEAMRLFKLAAEHGSAWAQARLAGSYATDGISLPQGWVDAFRIHVAKYLTLPPGVDASSDLRVRLRVQLNRDGTLSQTPSVMEGPASAAGFAFAQSALKALELAQPFAMLKAENYNQWKDMELVFEPKGIANVSGVQGTH